MIFSNESAAKMASLLLQIKAVKINTGQPFTWSSGWKSPVYCDTRFTLLFPEIRTFIKEQFASIIKEKFSSAELIAGVATAGIAPAVLVADHFQTPFCYVRSSPNRHGPGNSIAGLLLPGQKAVVIEDVISTGESSWNVLEVLRQAQVEVIALMALFTYGLPVSEKRFEEANCPFYTLTDYESLLTEALAQKTIHPDELSTLRKWREAPGKWGGIS